MMAAEQRWRVGILAFDEMELLDFAGPYEVFTTASRVAQKQGLSVRFEVQTIAHAMQRVRARAGLQITPDADFSNAAPCDVLMVPGGVVTDVLAQPEVAQWLRAVHPTTRYTVSVCTGAFLLAQAGILTGRATTHWEDLDDLQVMFPDLAVVSDVRWVQNDRDERVFSSAGISAGIDLSLHLLGLMTDVQLMRQTARQMDYEMNDKRVDFESKGCA